MTKGKIISHLESWTSRFSLNSPGCFFSCLGWLGDHVSPVLKDWLPLLVSGVSSLSQSCPHLQVLYLRRCLSLTDDGVIAVSRNCPMLRELNVGGCSRLTDASLVALGQNSRYLKSLNFSKTEVRDKESDRSTPPNWAIQVGLTPLTFVWHRLSPLAAFTSGAYFLHNGRQWQWICKFYTANVKGIFWGT